MDGGITVTLGQIISASSVLLGAGGIVYQVRSLGQRVGRLEKKVDILSNGMADKFVTRREWEISEK